MAYRKASAGQTQSFSCTPCMHHHYCYQLIHLGLCSNQQGYGKMLRVFIMLIHNCVRLTDPAIKRRFLIPKLWQQIYPYSIVRNTTDHKHFASFFAFAHMHALVSDGVSRPVTIDQFPQLNRSFRDIEYLHNLFHTAKEPEHKRLGDYLAVNGGAAVHVALLSDLVIDANSITSDANMQKAKPLLANMNNLALPSSAFAEEMCRWGLLEFLNSILTDIGSDLTNLKESVSHTVSCGIISVSVKHRCNDSDDVFRKRFYLTNCNI